MVEISRDLGEGRARGIGAINWDWMLEKRDEEGEDEERERR